MKQNKGITLVAMVITIIILLILAGITIAAINGEEGIFNTAQKSTDKNTEATALEEIKLVVFQVQTENLGKATLQQIVKKLGEDKKNTYIVTTKTKIATLITQDGSEITDASQVTDETEAIYITNTKYGHEIEVTSTLKVALAPVAEKGTVQNNVVPLSTITEENYGDYIDIGNDIVHSDSTDDDWRIFLKDDNYVYAILASYMPTAVVPSDIVTSTGMTKGTDGYTVTFSAGPTVMLNEEYWDFLVPEKLKDKVLAYGGATSAQLTTSWNTNPKNSSSKKPTNSYTFNLDASGLYMFGYGASTKIGPSGYWLAEYGKYNGGTSVLKIENGKGLDDVAKGNASSGLRPIIKLPLNLQVKEGETWALEN